MCERPNRLDVERAVWRRETRPLFAQEDRMERFKSRN